MTKFETTSPFKASGRKVKVTTIRKTKTRDGFRINPTAKERKYKSGKRGELIPPVVKRRKRAKIVKTIIPRGPSIRTTLCYTTLMKSSIYKPSEIEAKRSKIWKETSLYKFKLKGRKYYNLVEFPYPSGDLHLGHWFTFSAADASARFKKMKGENVFFPNGFDAFGLPAENAAIKKGVHPRDWTLSNVKRMISQFGTMGTMIDWDHKIITCLPEFFKWNQWIFIKMFEKGIAYRGKALSNWCPVDKTVLANEHIEGGKCWRCGTQVIQKEIEQWFLKITKYADRLIWKDQKVDWPNSVREGQNNWIGKSEGVLIDFSGIEVFTTRPETTDGATFIVLSPENPKVSEFLRSKEVKDYIDSVKKKTEMERKETKEKTGIFTGAYVTNPVTKKRIPVWIADYVLSTYGTGAIMAVPDCDERDREFAKRYKIPIVKSSLSAKPKGKKQVFCHLRDWSVSRQRYWGTPVPMIHCKNCGTVAVPYKDLPVDLPYEVDYAPKGIPPLASAKDWMKVKCPKCKGWAQRDPETLDTFFDSSWYLWRYVSPEYDKGPFDKTLAKKIMPVDVYFGGAEHTLGHTLYARFFTKFFKDLDLTNLEEFALKRIQHGVILGQDGFRMSKSRGNVVNPDELVKEYGADTLRVYLCFMMPYEATAPFNLSGIYGAYRFLKRIWELEEKVNGSNLDKDDMLQMNKTIQKVSDDLENFRFNTAIASLMSWLNHLSKKKNVSKKEYKNLVLLLAPFAPHLSEELYELLGEKGSVHKSSWPTYNSKLVQEEEITIVVQVNGKLRNSIIVDQNISKDSKKVEEKAKESLRVQKYVSQGVKKVIYVEGKVINFVV